MHTAVRACLRVCWLCTYVLCLCSCSCRSPTHCPLFQFQVEIDMAPLANGNPTVFVNNTAERGGAVFATITSTVAVNGMV